MVVLRGCDLIAGGRVTRIRSANERRIQFLASLISFCLLLQVVLLPECPAAEPSGNESLLKDTALLSIM